MRAAARLHCDRARRKPSEERNHLFPSQSLFYHRVSVPIDTMHSKHPLCQIHANGRNVHVGFLALEWSSNYYFGTKMPFNAGAARFSAMPR